MPSSPQRKYGSTSMLRYSHDTAIVQPYQNERLWPETKYGINMLASFFDKPCLVWSIRLCFIDIYDFICFYSYSRNKPPELWLGVAYGESCDACQTSTYWILCLLWWCVGEGDKLSAVQYASTSANHGKECIFDVASLQSVLEGYTSYTVQCKTDLVNTIYN